MSRHPFAWSCFIVSLSAFLGACGSSTDSYSEFVAAQVAKECEQFLRCENSEDGPIREGFTAEDCRRDYDERFDADVDAYVAAGTVRFDEAAARECLASYEDLCAGGQVAACDETLIGLVEDGQSCANDLECVSGACAGSADSCGPCDPRIPDGESCAGNQNGCRSDSYCAWDLSGSFCTPYPDTAAPRVQLARGEPCGYSETEDRRCAPDLYCDGEVCAERLVAGLRCDAEEDTCAFGTYCMEEAEAPNDYRCAPVELVTIVGADCGPLDSTYGICDRRLRLDCDFDTRTCERLRGDGEVGSECRYNADCNDSFCAFETCVAPTKTDGASCSYDVECESLTCAYVGALRQCADILVCN